MEIDMFLKLDSVQGESTDSKHTGEIEFRPNTTYRIRIYFEGSEIRQGGR
jgi:type VI protein secretion system component Hcp